MKALLVICALAVAYGVSSTASAQSYPSRPITIVVPFSAGGPTDTLARIMGERMRKALGQTIVVDNTTGAGGSIGTGKVIRAAPDGYTVSIGHWGTHVVNGAYYSLPYNLLTDFEAVALIATNPQAIISKNAVPAGNLKELIAWIIANQDKVLMGTGGVGGASHMGAIYFQNLIGVKFQYVPYRGGAPAMQALLGGEIDLYVTQVSNITTQIRSSEGSAQLWVLNAPPCPNEFGERIRFASMACGSSTTTNPRPQGIPGRACSVPVCLRVISATVCALRMRRPPSVPLLSII